MSNDSSNGFSASSQTADIIASQFFGFQHGEVEPTAQMLEFYKTIPKFYEGEFKRTDGLYLEPLKRDFEYCGMTYQVEIPPCKLVDTDGIKKDFYPSLREKLVEEVLWQLLKEGDYVSSDKSYDIEVGLKVIRERLKLLGHEYSIFEIRDSLYVFIKTLITIKALETNSQLAFYPIYDLMFLTEREAGSEDKDVVEDNDEEQEIIAFIKLYLC